MSSITTFISYAQESKKHNKNVKKLADSLQNHGVSCFFDQYEKHPSEGWTLWMRNRIEESDYVICICSRLYSEALDIKNIKDLRNKGARFEGMQILQEICNNGGFNEKYIPIIFNEGDIEFIPKGLNNYQYYNLKNDDGFEKLYRRITHQEESIPSIGERVSLRECEETFPDSLFQFPSLGKNPTNMTKKATEIDKASIELKLNTDFDTFGENDKNKLLEAVRKLLEISAVKITQIRKGSVYVTVEVPSHLAEKLLLYANAGMLGELNVVDAKYIENNQTSLSEVNQKDNLAKELSLVQDTAFPNKHKITSLFRKLRHDHSAIKSSILDESFGFYDENYFKELLVLERKRSERSGKPFLLSMVDVSSILKGKNKNEAAKNISSAIRKSCSEMDIKGWYNKNFVVGIIYVDIDSSKIDSIIQKLKDNFAKVMSPSNYTQNKITYIVFPQIQNHENVNEDSNAFLYPLPATKSSSRRISLVIKRIIDIIGSIFAISIFSPFFIMIPILIKLTSKGPVFYKSKRVGMYGKKFTFLKFRSMFVANNNDCHKEFVKSFIQNSNKEKKNGEQRVYKLKDDSRITPLGKFLRKTNLDELPQFFNVLWGDMSLIGPQPCLPYEFEYYGLWHRLCLLESKPGITCIWQVEGRSTTTFETMVRMDIQYITKWSLLLDVKLLAKIPLCIFRKTVYQ